MKSLLLILLFLPAVCVSQTYNIQKKACKYQFRDMKPAIMGKGNPIKNRDAEIRPKSRTSSPMKSKTLAQLADSNYTYSFFSPSDSLITSKSYFFYDSYGNETMEIDNNLNTDNNKWIGSGKYVYAFDANGNDTLEIDYNWDTTSNQWIGSGKYVYAYSANGNRTLQIDYNWDTINKQWINIYKFDSQYNAIGEDTLDLASIWDTTSNNWIVSWKYRYTYDNYGNETSEIDANWDTPTNRWIDFWKHEYTYDANGNETEEIYIYWDVTTSQWINDWDYQYSYDVNNNESMEIDSYWEETNSQWINYWKYNYFFDAGGNETLEIDSYWDNISNQWVLNSETFWYNSIHILSNVINSASLSSIRLYPDPANDRFNLEIFNSSVTHCHLFNSSGQLINSFPAIQGTNTYDISNIKPGMYFICVPAQNGTSMIKLIKN